MGDRKERWHERRGLTPPTPPNPSGLCMCGCGQQTTIAPKTSVKDGRMQGHPTKYVQGHDRKVLSGVLWIVEPETGCWIWQRSFQNTNRPQLCVWDKATKKRKLWSAYRYYYAEKYGPIPEGMEIDHLCCNPSCVNPDHMEVVTPKENLTRNLRRLRFAGRHWCKTGEIL